MVHTPCHHFVRIVIMFEKSSRYSLKNVVTVTAKFELSNQDKYRDLKKKQVRQGIVLYRTTER